MNATLTLTAPIAGWLMPLDDVPDPAFAGRMLGHGAAIDPTGSLLCAPCDGVVTLLADTRHAVTVKSESGIEILLHVGIDTVRLRGEGFTAHTHAGARVRRGDPLLELDLDRLARGAASLVTPVVTAGDTPHRVSALRPDGLVRAGEAILEIVSIAEARGSEPAAAIPDAVLTVVVAEEHGLHARPAARVARRSREYRARVVVSAHGRRARAGSTLELMALGTARGDTLELEAFGPDAAAAVRALAEEIGTGAGAPARPVAASAPQPAGGNAPARELTGAVASRGIAVGVAHRLAAPELAVDEQGGGAGHERAALAVAREAARGRLQALAGGAGGDVLAAQAELLDDPGLLALADAAIDEGKSAGFAWRRATREAAARLLDTGSALLAERAADLEDVERQVLAALTGREPQPPALPDAAIVLASELLPSELGRLDLARVAGLCTAGGGPTSHVALVAASLGIPAVVGAGPDVLRVPDGARVLLDAEAGRLHVEPGEDALARAEQSIAERRTRHARLLETAARACATADGCRIGMLANLTSAAEAAHAVQSGAEGCGLLRTELLFQQRRRAPTVDEQAREYQAIADALAPRPLVIRLLDVGGDKPIPCLPLPHEDNPLLGLRGLRVAFRHPEILRDQLAAILRTEIPGGRRVLLPMVNEPGDVRRVRELLAEAGDAPDRAGRVLLGAMIETPASVALADQIAREADFLSIGSNDLAQYTLALDRTHPELGAAFDHLHPAVLRQIVAVVAAAGERSVSVCGALASDSAAVPVLIGLGVRTLSAVPNAIPELKALIGALTVAECEALAAAALAEDDAHGVRRVLAAASGKPA